MHNDPFARLELDRTVLSVSQLNNRARLLLEDVFAQVWVEGEISNLAKPASGHLYFTLKDSQAQVRCALFRQQAARVRAVLRDGLAVRVRGRVSLFEGRGDYQLILDNLEPAGDGALRLAFEALKEQLSSQGLFAAERKKPLPAHPKRVGIISSPSGAVIRDIISVFKRRAPQIELCLIPSAVQGAEATAQLVRALQLADQQGFDALILARGGGSLEDLWCFNEQALAHAIAACQTPLISAVGHETDVSISDFVADLRAPTPSAAAELLAPDRSALFSQISGLSTRLNSAMQRRLQHEQQRVAHLQKRLRHPGERLRQQAQRLDDLDLRLRRALQHRLQQRRLQHQHLHSRLLAQHPKRVLTQASAHLAQLRQRLPLLMQEQLRKKQQRLKQLASELHLVSPLATLGRGYSILQDEQGQAIRNAAQVRSGQRLSARLAEGCLTVRVEDPLSTPSTADLFD